MSWIRILLAASLALGLFSCHFYSKKHFSSIRVNLYCDPPSLDPRKAADSTSINVLIALGEGLTRLGKGDHAYPALARKISISPDGLTYTFKLRPAFWSSGERIVAEDFVQTWRSLLDPLFPSSFAYKLFVIKNAEKVKEGLLPASALGVEALNLSTLVVHLEYPTPYFLQLAAFPTFYPLPSSQLHHDLDYSQVQNGPFVLKSWDHHHQMVLEKNPSYWDERHVELQEIEFLMVDDTITEWNLFEQGALDWAGSPLSNLPLECVSILNQEERLYTYPVAGVYTLKVNTQKKILSDPFIRKALAYAINREEIVRYLLEGFGESAQGYVPSLAWPDRTASQVFLHDQRQALTLFEEGLNNLGMNRKELPPLHFAYNANREHQRIAQILQQQWKEQLGIEIILDVHDWTTHLAKLSHLDYQIARSGWISDSLDPLSFLAPFSLQTGSMNETGWYNENFSFLLNEAALERNGEKRVALLRQAEELLLEEMPVIPLYFIHFLYAKKETLKGVYVSPLGTIDFRSAWVDVKGKKGKLI